MKINRAANNRVSKWCISHYYWLVTGLAFLLITALSSVGLLIAERRQYLPQTASGLISVHAENVAARFSSLLIPVMKDLKVIGSYLASGDITIGEPETAERIVSPILKKYPDIVSGLMIADSNGKEFKLVLLDGVHKFIRSDYDPRTRPWFGGALSAEAGKVFWTQIYQFHTSGKYGISASIAVRGQDNTKIVTAFDINLEDLGKLIASLSLPQESFLFLQNDLHLVDLSVLSDMDEPFVGAEKPAIDPVITQTALHRQKNKIAAGKPFSFKASGLVWWAEAMPLFTGFGDSEIVLVVSQAELVKSRNQSVLMVFILVFSAIILLSIILLILLRYQGQALTDAIRRKGCLNLNPQQLLDYIRHGEGDSVEFKSTLRINLHTDKPDRAIELACLKTVAAFLNSYGGTLIVGVKDDGEILGLANDKFDNDDKFMLHFNNLVSQCLGMNIANYLAFGIKEADNRKVFIVDCQRSSIPVFVSSDQREDFYVRVGPGTRLLNTSEAVEYIKNHF